MNLLDKKNYNLLFEPLKKVTINNLFARAVVENYVSGKVYVDNRNHPKSFYVLHPYGISLLFGDHNNQVFNEHFRDYSLNKNKIRDKHEWLQTFPHDWDLVLKELFKDCMLKSSDNVENKVNGIIELNTRVNFKFNIQKYLDFKRKYIPADLKVVRSDKNIFNEMKGSVIPLYFWDTADDFFKKGIGFSFFYNCKLASTAYSAFLIEDKLEIGIETVEEFRGKGFAQYTCSALIDYSIENNYEPVWSCRNENTASYKLAQKLGFEPSKEIPFYRLSN
jgi:GNAT superfamily N-acetyltransferase